MARIQNRGVILLAAALSVAPILYAVDLPARIQKTLETAQWIRRGFLGLEIVDLATGKILFESNADRLFVPASNSKLFTTALALTRLGPAYRFQTTVIASSGPDRDGRIAGPVSLVGGGDPNLSGRELPYRVDSPAGDGLQPIADLAAQMVARGVRRIDGDIIGDDTAYTWDPYPEGWALGDALWEYGAPVSALTINDNAFTLRLTPGDPAGISIDPPLEFYQLDNLVQPGPARKIRIGREPGSRQLRISGTLPLKDPGVTEVLAIHDPALYAAVALRDALTRNGVAVQGEAVARHALPGEAAGLPSGVELARRDSAPLIEDLRVTAKVSQNLHAELLFRAVARARRGSGSVDAGMDEMRAFLKEAGITPGEFQASDASGLSRLNLVTPAAVVKLLQFLYRSPYREDWMSLLPIGGEDGTLRLRLRDTSAAGRIRAKTGSLTHVTALSGYAERKDGSMLAFSFLANNQGASASEVRAVLDRLCVLMTE
jgi:D-alanyl-D-alanine carboxypeptidase/D-alanyl-D-alanine-endopeptidase (penicillin-binding protein 4)